MAARPKPAQIEPPNKIPTFSLKPGEEAYIDPDPLVGLTECDLDALCSIPPEGFIWYVYAYGTWDLPFCPEYLEGLAASYPTVLTVRHHTSAMVIGAWHHTFRLGRDAQRAVERYGRKLYSYPFCLSFIKHWSEATYENRQRSRLLRREHLYGLRRYYNWSQPYKGPPPSNKEYPPSFKA
jgi:hypothetical protein